MAARVAAATPRKEAWLRIAGMHSLMAKLRGGSYSCSHGHPVIRAIAAVVRAVGRRQEVQHGAVCNRVKLMDVASKGGKQYHRDII